MSADHSRTRWTVLLAEDDDNDVFILTRAVKLLGLVEEVFCVRDGGEVIEYLLGNERYAGRDVSQCPNLLLMDQVMPRLSGLETLCWLRSEPRFVNLPVIVLSSLFSQSQTEMVERLHAVCAMKTLKLADQAQEIHNAISLALGRVGRSG
jgi:CheY-like chemotaxis protein